MGSKGDGASAPPEWFSRASALHSVVEHEAARCVAQATRHWDVHQQALPQLAIRHVDDCIVTGLYANAAGRHAVGLALVRQTVEALAIVELGLLGSTAALEELTHWEEGHRKHGELRKFLERESWSSYPPGLWNERWTDFQTSLARAVQVHAHFTSELLQWQLKLIHTDLTTEQEQRRMFAFIGPGVDPDKAERVTLVCAVVVWALGRMVQHLGTPSPEMSRDVDALGMTLVQSRWFFPGEDWSLQLAPHVWFKEAT